MRISTVVALLGSGLCVIASPDGPDDKVTALSGNEPTYLVGANVYSTTTLYTTSYFTITECAPDASNCPTNALTVVTSVVLASTTTTLCLVTTTPGLFPSIGQPQVSPTASWTASIPATPPSATGALPTTSETVTNKPTDSNVTSNTGFPVFPSHGLLPIPGSGIPIGPGPIIPSNSQVSIPSGANPSVPPASITGAPSLSYPTVSPLVPSIPTSGNLYVSSPGVPSLSAPGVPTISSPVAPSAPSPGVSSSHQVPGAPSQPYPNSGASSAPASGGSPTLGLSTTPTAAVPSHAYSGVSPTPSSSAPITSVPQVPTPGIPTGSGNGHPYVSSPRAPGSPPANSASSPTGNPYNTLPTDSASGPTSGPSATGTEGTKMSSLPSTPGGLPAETTVHSIAPTKSPSYTPAPGPPKTTTASTSSAEEGTSTTQITSIAIYPHTTFVVTAPMPTSSHNYSTETLGIHTSFGTDASAYIPTGSGWWPSATNNGTVNSPTPTSPIPINNEGQQAFGSGKSCVIAIVIALAFAHFT